MWYERYQGIPPRNSLLESLFVLIYLSRQEAQLLATKAMVVGMNEGNPSEQAVKAYTSYFESVFPFIERAANVEQDQQKKYLEEFVKHPAKINLKPILMAKAQEARQRSQRRAMRVKPKMPGVS